MYEELLKRIRQVAEEVCEDYDVDPYNAEQRFFVIEEAAKAIEEMQKKYDGAVSDNKSLCRQIAELAKERNEAYSKGVLEGGIAQRAEDEKWMPKWIPVTERLPEKSGSYLVYVYGEVTEMDCWRGKWHMLGDDYTKAVTHWMPLPKPPKEESNGV